MAQLLLLLGATVFIVLAFQKLGAPSSLAYLLVGILLGSNTAGPVVPQDNIRTIAEFGIVFLLFSIGLTFSIAKIYSLRHTILGLGTAQVVLTTLIVGLLAWGLGLPAPAAFVVGAVFAQSSTTIIARQLMEQGEGETRHGRLGTTLSVFQDVTAVPFIVVIPALGVAAAHQVAEALGIALLKAGLALGVVMVVGHYLLKPLFYLVAERRSAELFTLTVLFVSLVAAWVTKSMGLSMAFGAFLAGMMLGGTEFRHQVESTIRPFRDVLLGLFFVSIGMLFDPALLPDIWLEALLGCLALLAIKLTLVTIVVRFSGVDLHTGFRVGMILAVGGEFGFALLAVGLEGGIIDDHSAQIVLNAVLLSMVLAPVMIRFNQPLALQLFGKQYAASDDSIGVGGMLAAKAMSMRRHVVICGYGRTGQVVSHFLESEGIEFVAVDTDPVIVREAHLAGHPVYYGDASDPVVLEVLGIEKAALLLITHDDETAALATLRHTRQQAHHLRCIVRTRDERHSDELKSAGATEVIPDTLETGMIMVSHSLLTLDIPLSRVTQQLQEQRMHRYPMLRELFRGTLDKSRLLKDKETEQLHSVLLNEDSPAVGRQLASIELDSENVLVASLVRNESRLRQPSGDTVLEVNDVLVLMGSFDDLKRAEYRLTGVVQLSE